MVTRFERIDLEIKRPRFLSAGLMAITIIDGFYDCLGEGSGV
jgi:hypothetical protein